MFKKIRHVICYWKSTYILSQQGNKNESKKLLKNWEWETNWKIFHAISRNLLEKIFNFAWQFDSLFNCMTHCKIAADSTQTNESAKNQWIIWHCFQFQILNLTIIFPNCILFIAQTFYEWIKNHINFSGSSMVMLIAQLRLDEWEWMQITSYIAISHIKIK